ncbi:uncharacterized protein DS421_1g31540 [Arachis hypogaea]|nr:uncharacterized protein DS421_1g31540 [Arachis hypogaea]
MQTAASPPLQCTVHVTTLPFSYHIFSAHDSHTQGQARICAAAVSTSTIFYAMPVPSATNPRYHNVLSACVVSSSAGPM